MRQHYFPESVSVWENTLLHTGSGGLPVFSGVPYQRGHGIGMDSETGVGKEALRTGSEVASDYLTQGADPKQALKRRARQAAGRTLKRLANIQHRRERD